MGRNNLDYKLKDKRLTKNKRNAKLNKSIAFALASVASISLGSSITEVPREVKAQSSTQINKSDSLKKFPNSKNVHRSKRVNQNFTSQDTRYK